MPGSKQGGWLLVRKIPKPGGRPLQCAIAIISNRSSLLWPSSAINEPLSDASLTPGLEQYYSDFVTITRVVEFTIGVKCEADLPKVDPAPVTLQKCPLAALQAAIPLIVTYAGKGKVR
ncbi:hypothetical protein KEM48_014273 [Puccinia striiformis f. sp. tritici PST-130]|nr:hypothetical protein KEM48_014273 [Puccinia striiformis f. sp. tritici PST-130]